MLDFMPTIYLAFIAIIIGIIGLVWSADRFVAGSASIAKGFGVAPMIIGLTIVSFGTSAPEVMVSIIAAFSGAGDLAVGNALGSNIANIALVLGATTLIAYIPVQKHLLKHELPILMVITLISGYILMDASISVIEGWVLMLLLVPSIWYLVFVKQREFSTEEKAEEEELPELGKKAAIVWFLIGLGLLIISSKILVWGAETTALHFHVSPLIIGLTIIAIGTSLPELAASVISAVKGHHDIALGNIIGSNMFNLLAVMSIPGIVGSQQMDSLVFSRDYMTMLAVTLFLALTLVVVIFGTKSLKLGKLSGVILLLSYVAYMAVLASEQL
ncbi:Inner membrane protein YrbG [Thalassocella blandensis]|nr:Inner membrane protein YrbG [Thalassocella blandensis]